MILNPPVLNHAQLLLLYMPRTPMVDIGNPTNLTITDNNSIATLNLQQHAARILDVLLDLDEELHCLPAV